MAGPDTHVLSLVPNAHVDITGISGSPLEQLPLVQCAALVNTLDKGQVILIMLQYAHLPKGKTSHSKSQLESNHHQQQGCQRRWCLLHQLHCVWGC